MNYLESILSGLGSRVGQGYQRPPDLSEQNLEASSSILDLEGESNHRVDFKRVQHRNAKSNSNLNVNRPFEDDTTSFYSALNDGFPMDELELCNKYSQESLWNFDTREHQPTEQSSDFQVTWYELNYTIEPANTVSGLVSDSWANLMGRLQSFPNLVYSKPAEKTSGGRPEEVSILRNVNGAFKSGELTAVMGPSGAGKTSLLNILSRRREDGFTGQIHVSDTTHRLRINAIPQHDNLQETFSVRENLMFASRLKNPIPNQNHEKGVSLVSNLLGLNECLDTRTRNISGGQQKRLAIAQELLSRPDILILDEPTSGLDSLTCLKTLAVLKDLVKASRKKMIDPIAIVLTIHQPQQEAFNTFDKVYVMANGGIAIYDGPPARCTEFVERYSGLRMPSEDYNPASFLIEIASGEYGQEPIEALAQQVRLEYGKMRCQRNSSHEQLDKGSKPSDKTGHRGGQPDLYLDHRLVKSSEGSWRGALARTMILTERCWKSSWSNKMLFVARILFSLSVPLALAIIIGTDAGNSNACPQYYSEFSLAELMQSDAQVSSDVQQEFMLVNENTAVMFMIVFSCNAACISAMTLTFVLDMRTCLKEYHNGWYSMYSYVFARLISNIPLELILPTITMAITYVVTGQNTGTGSEVPDALRIGITSMALFLASMATSVLAMMFAAIYPENLTTAVFAAQCSTIPFVLLSGFISRLKNMSQYVRYLSVTSVYRHCIEIVFIARYGWNVCDCDREELLVEEPHMTGVSTRLRNFVKYYLNSRDDSRINEIEPSQINSTAEPDLFRVIAKQLSLYNTYGIEVKSCDQIVPYNMYDFWLDETQVANKFIALIVIFSVSLITLLLLVRFVLTQKPSL